MNYVFFGSPEFSSIILDELLAAGYPPAYIVTGEDKAVGRKQVITPPPVKVWAEQHNIPYHQTNNPKNDREQLKHLNADLFIVAAFGYILPKEVIDIPHKGTLNVHTSLLPQFRGASPIESAILHGVKETGSTIMLMDEKLDHGPILAQEAFPLDPDMHREELFNHLAHHGGRLLAETLPLWIEGTLSPQEQDHKKASYCHKINKSDGDITHDPDDLRYRKYLAYYGWPGVFYFDQDGKRMKVTEAHFNNGTFTITKIIPEGKQEIVVEKNLA